MRASRQTVVHVAIVAVAVAALAFAGVARLVRWRAAAELDDERDRLADARVALEEAEWQQHVPAPKQDAQWRLLDGTEVAATLQVVQTLVDASGVTLLAAKASPSVNAGRQMFLLAGHGRPEQVCALVASIERHERLIVVETGRVSPRDGEQIEFEFGLATWHRDGGAR